MVRIKTFINPDGRTVPNLGREREGSGIVIDSDGLVLTIGYLMVEAHAAEVVTNDGRTVPANVVGYDHETGFGLLKATAAAQPAAHGARQVGRPQGEGPGAGGELRRRRHGRRRVHVVARREFAGSWEYLLDEAIFTTPPHPAWSGAALINREGKLVGVGSLIVGDAGGKGDGEPGNMFVPIDRLPPILADLIADGRASRAGAAMARRDDRGGRAGGCWSARVTPGGPAEKAGVQRATSSSASAARRPRASPTSTARCGRAAAPAPPCRSTCCATAQPGASTWSR